MMSFLGKNRFPVETIAALGWNNLGCRWVEDNLLAYVEKDLEAKHLSRVETHLTQCKACSQKAISYEKQIKLLTNYFKSQHHIKTG